MVDVLMISSIPKVPRIHSIRAAWRLLMLFHRRSYSTRVYPSKMGYVIARVGQSQWDEEENLTT